jgi:hypothetical protein
MMVGRGDASQWPMHNDAFALFEPATSRPAALRRGPTPASRPGRLTAQRGAAACRRPAGALRGLRREPRPDVAPHRDHHEWPPRRPKIEIAPPSKFGLAAAAKAHEYSSSVGVSLSTPNELGRWSLCTCTSDAARSRIASALAGGH